MGLSGVLSEWGFVRVGFGPSGVMSSGVMSEWGFVQWGYVRLPGYAQFILPVILCLICQQNIGTHLNEITYICDCPRNARHLSVALLHVHAWINYGGKELAH